MPKTTDTAPSSLRFRRYCVLALLAGTVALLWLSLLTFNPTDPPSKLIYPPRNPVANAAGLIGAHVAYDLLYWLGSGTFILAAAATTVAAIWITGRRVADLPCRAAGTVLLAISVSAAVYVQSQHASDEFLASRFSPGVLGVVIGRLVLARFGPTGTWLLLAIVAATACLLVADEWVAKFGRALARIFHPKTIAEALAALKPNLSSFSFTLPGRGAKKSRRLTPAPTSASAQSAGAHVATPQVADKPLPKSVSTPAPAALAPARPAPALPLLTAAKPVEDDKPTDRPIVRPSTTPAELPPPDLLAAPSNGYLASQEANAATKQTILQQTLDDFNVEAGVVGFQTGPVITMFELSVAPGVKVSQIANLANDIARALAVPGVRIVSPIPGKDTIGIEVPNLDKEIVRIRELMDLAPDAADKMNLPLYLGKDAGGSALVADLAAMPHMLIAGTTGSGKSVCINSIIVALLMTRLPEQCRLILIDPKMVEMAAFEEIPHLLCPIVNDAHKAAEILAWAAEKMDERYELLKEANVKNLAAYNRLTPKELYERFDVVDEEERARIPKYLPYLVIIVDELADLVMTGSKEVEHHIIRIAQKARAVGIHLILSTQRPSVNVVTGLIKSNMPCRASFRVASRQESRIVLDQNGAEVLLGQGDMLLLQPGTSNLVRAQGTYVDDSEIRSVVKALRESGPPSYDNDLMQLQCRAAGDDGDGQRDELFSDAVEIVLSTKRGSVSLLQRRLQVGYSRASRMIDQMAAAGILGAYKGSQARECLITIEDWQGMQESITADQSGESAMDGEPTSA